MMFFLIPLGDHMTGIYEVYADLALGVTIIHRDAEEMEGEILMEVAHGYGDFWKQRRTPMACRPGCTCGNARPGTA